MKSIRISTFKKTAKLIIFIVIKIIFFERTQTKLLSWIFTDFLIKVLQSWGRHCASEFVNWGVNIKLQKTCLIEL